MVLLRIWARKTRTNINHTNYYLCSPIFKEMQCPETWIYSFPYHGLTIRAYLKCATQKILRVYNDANRYEFQIYSIDNLILNSRIRPGLVLEHPNLKQEINWYDSGLSVQQEYTLRTIDTDQGSARQQNKLIFY